MIVPVRDDPDGIRELLTRLETQTFPQDQFEIVVGDDGSKPGSLSGIATSDGRIRVLEGPPRTSYAARNRAARAARGTVLAFCDADCLPDERWLEAGLEALAAADVVAGEVIFEVPSRPTVWSLLTVDMFLDQARNVRFSRAVTANILLRRKLFEEVGGFDESLPSGGDYNFTRRAASYGARLVHAPGAIVRHPTIDNWRSFLRKVWFTNRWSAVRNARLGLPLDYRALVEFAPLVGVALARRRALRPVAGLCRARLVQSGLDPGWREDLRAVPLIYFVVANVAGAARISGRFEGVRAFRANRPVSTVKRAAVAHAPKGALPNLVVIGAQKCGTGSLHFYLGLHPAISMSKPKELNFFIEERNWPRGADWYRRRFDPVSPIRGESSPNYAAAPAYQGVAGRMATLIPEARLIYLVRDPIERIASHWVHNYARRREKGDLATTLHHPGSSYVVRSCYYRQLEHFLEHFDGSQVMVIESAELNNRRLHTLRRVFAFLGVDPDFYHPGFDSLIHRSAAKRRGSRLSVGLSRLSRKVLGFRVHVPLWASVEAALGLSGRIPATGNVREALGEGVIDILRDDAEKLRAHTGLDLDHWSVFQDPPGSVR